MHSSHDQSVETLPDNPRTDSDPNGGSGEGGRGPARRQKDWLDRLRPFVFLYAGLLIAAIVLVEVQAVRDSRTREATGVAPTAATGIPIATSPTNAPQGDVATSGHLSAPATAPILEVTPFAQPTPSATPPIVSPSVPPVAPSPSVASPSVSPQPTVRVQDTVAFAQGSAQGMTTEPSGAFSLIPTVSDDFDAVAIDNAQWQLVPWGAGGTVVLRDGMATVNVAAIRSRRAFVHRTLEARMRFTAGAQPFQNLAWSADLNGNTAILIGKPQADPSHLYARVKHEGEADRLVQLPVSLEDGEFHTYRIAWESDRVEFFVDGAMDAAIPIALDMPMFAWISTAGAQPLAADWARILDYGEVTGMFTARPIDAGTRTFWQTITIRGAIPAGTQVLMQTRTSADGVSWSAYAPVDDGGTITSPPGRYLQYTVAINGTAESSPTLFAVVVTDSPISSLP